jgi:hypothetical protein
LKKILPSKIITGNNQDSIAVDIDASVKKKSWQPHLNLDGGKTIGF